MAGLSNVYLKIETTLDDGSHVIGNLARPKSITLATGIKYERDYSLTSGATATKIFDEDDFANPSLVVVEWTDGPIELAWGADAAAASSDTSSFVSNDAVGGWHIFWGSGHQSHEGEAVSDRNSVDNTGGRDIGLQEIWATQTSGAAIKVHVTAYK